MQSYTRHQLKEDKFKEVTREALAQAQAHQKQLIVGGIILLLIVIAAGGYAYWNGHQDDAASAAMGEAMNTYSAPIRTPDAPVDPTITSFASAKERDAAAEKQFDGIAANFPHTPSGKNAVYMSGVAALDEGNYSLAEAKFKKAADIGNKDVASLAKMGLASVYEATNRDQDAINTYTELMKKPTLSVSKDRVQFALAALYEKKNPAEAKKVYEELAKNKDNLVAQIAKQREAGIGSAPAAH